MKGLQRGIPVAREPIMFDTSKIKKMIHDMASAMRTIDQNIAAKVKMVEELKTAPLAYEDIDTAIDLIFERRANEYLKNEFVAAVEFIANHPLKTIDRLLIGGRDSHHFISTSGLNTLPTTLEKALMSLLKDQLKLAIKEKVRLVKLDKQGPVLEKRLPMIAELEKELEDLRESKQKINKEANDAGLTL
jgi:hypothetical protein